MDFIKKLAFDVLIKAAIKRLFVRFPLLGWGPIGFFVSKILMEFAEDFYALGKEFFQDWAIKKLRNTHQKEFDEEFIKLAIIEKDPNAKPKDLQNAIEQAQEKLANLVVYSQFVPRS